MFRTGNPSLNNQAFSEPLGYADAAPAPSGARANHMTLQGTVNKTALSIAMCVATAVLAWNLAIDKQGEVYEFNTGLLNIMTFGGMIVGLVLALILCFKPRFSAVIAPLYALVEGFFVGGISAFYALMMSMRDEQNALATPADAALTAGSGGAKTLINNLNMELIFNAVLLTFGIAGGLLAAYAFKLIRPNRLFYNITITATLGLVLYGLVAIVASFFGSYSLASVYDPNNGGLLAIGFSGLVVGLASMNLVLDFDIINNGVKNRAPKYMEWYGAFAVLVTLVWLYISLLRLLAQLQSRN